MDYYGIGELQYYMGKTDEDLWKAIRILRELERKIGGSTGEFAAFRNTLNKIRSDIAVAHKRMHQN